MSDHTSPPPEEESEGTDLPEMMDGNIVPPRTGVDRRVREIVLAKWKSPRLVLRKTYDNKRRSPSRENSKLRSKVENPKKPRVSERTGPLVILEREEKVCVKRFYKFNSV